MMAHPLRPSSLATQICRGAGGDGGMGGSGAVAGGTGGSGGIDVQEEGAAGGMSGADP
jgi:hypothetical protein